MKKTIISLLLVAILAFGAGFGTLAYYTNTFNSNGNSIVTANFNPTKGSSQWERTEEISGQTFAPGKDISFSYGIDLNKTEVPVKYIIKINHRNENSEDQFGFFSEGSPIKYELSVFDNGTGTTSALQKNTDGNYEFIPAGNGRRAVFFIKYIWPFESYKNDVRIPDEKYAGKKGYLDLSVEVRQIREEESKYIDGKTYVSTFGASNDGKTCYAEIGFNQPIAKQLKSLTFVAFDKNNKRIASTSATPQTILGYNNGFIGPMGNTFMTYDDTTVTVRQSTGPWTTNKYSDEKPYTIKAFFEFTNDTNIYGLEQFVGK